MLENGGTILSMQPFLLVRSLFLLSKFYFCCLNLHDGMEDHPRFPR